MPAGPCASAPRAPMTQPEGGAVAAGGCGPPRASAPRTVRRCWTGGRRCSLTGKLCATPAPCAGRARRWGGGLSVFHVQPDPRGRPARRQGSGRGRRSIGSPSRVSTQWRLPAPVPPIPGPRLLDLPKELPRPTTHHVLHAGLAPGKWRDGSVSPHAACRWRLLQALPPGFIVERRSVERSPELGCDCSFGTRACSFTAARMARSSQTRRRSVVTAGGQNAYFGQADKDICTSGHCRECALSERRRESNASIPASEPGRHLLCKRKR